MATQHPKSLSRRFTTGFSAIVLSLAAAVLVRADTLVFTNGDSLTGVLLKKEGGNIVFKSTRFGELTVPENEAVVKPATTTPAPAATPAQPAPPPAAPATTTTATTVAAGNKPAPSDQAAKPAPWWKQWHGSISTSMGIDSDLTERSLVAVNGKIGRLWEQDEVQLEGSHDYTKDAGNVTMDFLKLSGMWSHRFGKKLFSEYRSYYEHDPVTSKASQLQQQIGIGRFLLNGGGNTKIRAGIGENLFNTWPMNEGDSTQKSVESLFTDVSFALPWRITITGRGVYYFSISGGTDAGWEGSFEFSKKLTDSFTVGFRFEVRKSNPDPRMTDFQRTRFLLGYDF
jgi:hypothetical protein